MNETRLMIVIMAGIELALGFPFVGGFFIVSLLWIPLGLALLAHITTLIFAIINKESVAPSIVGICANTIGFIPGIGMLLHLAAGITGMVIGFKKGD